MHVRLWRAVVLAMIAMAAVAVISACGGSDSNDSGASGATTASGSSAGAKQGKGLIIDLNGPLTVQAFQPMKLGADAAAKELGINYQWSATKDLSNFVPDYSTLIEQAIARRPDALVIGNFVPSAFDPLIKKAVAQGIPVVIVNGGLSTFPKTGAIAYVGASAEQAGTAGGAAMVKAGARNVVCVNSAPANPDLHRMCGGLSTELEKAGGRSAELQIPTADGADPAALQRNIAGYLASHPDVDGIQTIGANVAAPAIAAVKAANKSGKVAIGGVDVSQNVLRAIKAGEMTFVIDSQQYLQGYLSLQIAAQYLKYKVHPTAPVMTGGLVVDKENVDDVLAVQEQHPGLRGAG